MKITELKDEIKTVALEGVESFTMDWAHVINESKKTYDLMLMVPPKRLKKISPDNPNSVWEVLFYIFRPNNDGTGNPCTEDERDTIWEELETKADTFVTTLFDRDRLMTKFSKMKMFPITELEITYDENAIGTDQLIYVQGTFRCQTLNDC